MTALNTQVRHRLTATVTRTGFVLSIPKIVSRFSYVTLIAFAASIIASCSYANDKNLPKYQSEKNEGSLLSVENSTSTSSQNVVASEKKKFSQSDKGYSIQATNGFTLEDFDWFNPVGFRIFNGCTETGVLFVNDDLVCDRF